MRRASPPSPRGANRAFLLLYPRVHRALGKMIGSSSPSHIFGWVLGVSSFASPAVSFSPWGVTSPSLLHSPHRDPRSISLRLAPRHENEVEEDTAGNVDVSDFDRTSSPVKAFVGGLTDLFVRFSDQEGEDDSLPPPVPKVTALCKYLFRLSGGLLLAAMTMYGGHACLVFVPVLGAREVAG